MTLSSHWTSSLSYGTPISDKPLLRLLYCKKNENDKPSMRCVCCSTGLLWQPIATLQDFQKLTKSGVPYTYSYLGYYWWKWYLRLYVINFYPLFWSPFPIKNEKNVIYGRPLGFSLVIIGANFSIVVCICSSELATMTCNEGGEILSPNLTIHGRTVQRYSAKMIRLSWEEMIKANI